jgi:hypothetical protein
MACWINNDHLCISPTHRKDPILVKMDPAFIEMDKNQFVITNQVGLIEAEVMFGLNEIFIHHKSHGGMMCELNQEVVSFFNQFR